MSFLERWPDLEAATRLVVERESETDGGACWIPDNVADRLSEKYPDVATRFYRRKVESVLERRVPKYYRYAIRDFHHCARLAERISPTPDFPDHETYVANLRQRHGRKYGFWNKV